MEIIDNFTNELDNHFFAAGVGVKQTEEVQEKLGEEKY